MPDKSMPKTNSNEHRWLRGAICAALAVRTWRSAQLEKVLGLIEATPEEKLHLMRFARLFDATGALYKQPA
jgi:hypothetical protein